MAAPLQDWGDSLIRIIARLDLFDSLQKQNGMLLTPIVFISKN